MQNNNSNQNNAGAQVPPGIVSVNARGGTNSGVMPKIIFVIFVLVVLVLGAVFALNKFISSRKAAALEAKAPTVENKAASVSQHRIFDTDPPVSPPLPANARSDSNVASTGAPTTAPGLCPDGTAGTELKGADGKPVMGTDGAVFHACKDGKVVSVPALQTVANPGDKPIPVTGGQPQANGQAASRYSGDVVIPPPNSQMSAQQTSPNNQAANAAALISSLLGRNGAPQPNPGFAGGSPSGNAAAPGADGGSTQALSTAGPTGNQQGSLGGLLSGSQTNRVSAGMMGDQNLLLSEGKMIDCALTIKMINEVSGKASCVLQHDVVSDNGRVILLEKGSEASGEYVAQMSVGQRRLFVLWTRIRTPYGVYVNVGSPGSDALGTTGMDGYVDNRWGDRIGAAFMLSLVQDAVGYATAKASSGNGNSGVAVLSNTSQTGNSIAQRVLEATINIKPTLYKNQGDMASIYVARDMDFRSVYALRAN